MKAPRHRPRAGTQAALAALISTAMAVTLVNPAAAEDTSPAGDVSVSTATAIATEELAGVLPLATGELTAAGGQLVLDTSGGQAQTSLPVQADGAVAVTGEDGQTTSIELPTDGAAAPARQIDDSTVVYANTAPSTDTAVTAPAEGIVETFHILRDAEAPQVFDYPVTVPDGGTLRQVDPRTVEVLDRDGLVTLTASAPWAKDATGTDVPARLVTTGDTVRFEVDHGDDHVYPVTADPIWVAGAVIYLVGYRCGVGAGGAMLAYRLLTERRSLKGYFTNAAIGCLTGGFGFRRLW